MVGEHVLSLFGWGTDFFSGFDHFEVSSNGRSTEPQLAVCALALSKGRE